MDTTPITHISLCTGYGGIDLGLRRVYGPGLRTVAYSEIEAYACENLLAKMEQGELDIAPIWSDLKTFPYQAFHGMVDILSGGYPCQPFSAAGKRRGEGDDRHLWGFISSGIKAMRPAVCFFENVEGHITLGLSTVISDLEDMGYSATWGVFSAVEVGAPHQRKRVFIMAYNKSQRVQGLRPVGEQVAPSHGRQEVPVCGRPRTDWSDGTTEPVLVGMDDGGSDWVDRLRLLGNGVAPQVAALAYRTLIKRLL